MRENRGHHEVKGRAVGRLQRGLEEGVLPIFISLLCKLIEELGSSDFPTPATPPVLCPFLGFISEVDRGQK